MLGLNRGRGPRPRTIIYLFLTVLFSALAAYLGLRNSVGPPSSVEPAGARSKPVQVTRAMAVELLRVSKMVAQPSDKATEPQDGNHNQSVAYDELPDQLRRTVDNLAGTLTNLLRRKPEKDRTEYRTMYRPEFIAPDSNGKIPSQGIRDDIWGTTGWTKDNTRTRNSICLWFDRNNWDTESRRQDGRDSELRPISEQLWIALFERIALSSFQLVEDKSSTKPESGLLATYQELVLDWGQARKEIEGLKEGNDEGVIRQAVVAAVWAGLKANARTRAPLHWLREFSGGDSSTHRELGVLALTDRAKDDLIRLDQLKRRAAGDSIKRLCEAWALNRTIGKLSIEQRYNLRKQQDRDALAIAEAESKLIDLWFQISAKIWNVLMQSPKVPLQGALLRSQYFSSSEAPKPWALVGSIARAVLALLKYPEMRAEMPIVRSPSSHSVFEVFHCEPLGSAIAAARVEVDSKGRIRVSLPMQGNLLWRVRFEAPSGSIDTLPAASALLNRDEQLGTRGFFTQDLDVGLGPQTINLAFNFDPEKGFVEPEDTQQGEGAYIGPWAIKLQSTESASNQFAELLGTGISYSLQRPEVLKTTLQKLGLPAWVEVEPDSVQLTPAFELKLSCRIISASHLAALGLPHQSKNLELSPADFASRATLARKLEEAAIGVLDVPHDIPQSNNLSRLGNGFEAMGWWLTPERRTYNGQKLLPLRLVGLLRGVPVDVGFRLENNLLVPADVRLLPQSNVTDFEASGDNANESRGRVKAFLENWRSRHNSEAVKAAIKVFGRDGAGDAIAMLRDAGQEALPAELRNRWIAESSQWKDDTAGEAFVRTLLLRASKDFSEALVSPESNPRHTVLDSMCHWQSSDQRPTANEWLQQTQSGSISNLHALLRLAHLEFVNARRLNPRLDSNAYVYARVDKERKLAGVALIQARSHDELVALHAAGRLSPINDESTLLLRVKFDNVRTQAEGSIGSGLPDPTDAAEALKESLKQLRERVLRQAAALCAAEPVTGSECQKHLLNSYAEDLVHDPLVAGCITGSSNAQTALNAGHAFIKKMPNAPSSGGTWDDSKTQDVLMDLRALSSNLPQFRDSVSGDWNSFGVSRLQAIVENGKLKLRGEITNAEFFRDAEAVKALGKALGKPDLWSNVGRELREAFHGWANGELPDRKQWTNLTTKYQDFLTGLSQVLPTDAGTLASRLPLRLRYSGNAVLVGGQNLSSAFESGAELTDAINMGSLFSRPGFKLRVEDGVTYVDVLFGKPIGQQTFPLNDADWNTSASSPGRLLNEKLTWLASDLSRATGGKLTITFSDVSWNAAPDSYPGIEGELSLKLSEGLTVKAKFGLGSDGQFRIANWELVTAAMFTPGSIDASLGDFAFKCTPAAPWLRLSDTGLSVHYDAMLTVPAVGCGIGTQVAVSFDYESGGVRLKLEEDLKVELPFWVEAPPVAFGRPSIGVNFEKKLVSLQGIVSITPGEASQLLLKLVAKGSIQVQSPYKLELTGNVILLSGLLDVAQAKVEINPTTGSFKMNVNASVAGAFSINGELRLEARTPFRAAGREEDANIEARCRCEALGIKPTEAQLGGNWNGRFWAQTEFDLGFFTAQTSLDYTRKPSRLTVRMKGEADVGVAWAKLIIEADTSHGVFVLASAAIGPARVEARFHVRSLHELNPALVAAQLTKAMLSFEAKVGGSFAMDKVDRNTPEGGGSSGSHNDGVVGTGEAEKPPSVPPASIEGIKAAWRTEVRREEYVEYSVNIKFGVSIKMFPEKKFRWVEHHFPCDSWVETHVSSSGDDLRARNVYYRETAANTLRIFLDNSNRMSVYRASGGAPVWQGATEGIDADQLGQLDALFAGGGLAVFGTKQPEQAARTWIVLASDKTLKHAQFQSSTTGTANEWAPLRGGTQCIVPPNSTKTYDEVINGSINPDGAGIGPQIFATAYLALRNYKPEGSPGVVAEGLVLQKVSDAENRHIHVLSAKRDSIDGKESITLLEVHLWTSNDSVESLCGALKPLASEILAGIGALANDRKDMMHLWLLKMPPADSQPSTSTATALLAAKTSDARVLVVVPLRQNGSASIAAAKQLGELRVPDDSPFGSAISACDMFFGPQANGQDINVPSTDYRFKFNRARLFSHLATSGDDGSMIRMDCVLICRRRSNGSAQTSLALYVDVAGSERNGVLIVDDSSAEDLIHGRTAGYTDHWKKPENATSLAPSIKLDELLENQLAELLTALAKDDTNGSWKSSPRGGLRSGN